MSEGREGRTDALRPLWAAAEQAEAIRVGIDDDAAEREAVLALSDAVEWSLRRLLRDADEAPLPVRLRSLAPEELRGDEVLAELRQHDLISIELAAGVHELFEVRTRLLAGAPTYPTDGALALRAADRLEEEVSAPRPAPPPADDLPPAPPPEDTRDATAARALPRPSRRWLGLAGALALVLIALFALLRAAGAGDEELARGIALFRSGAYADAAAHFWRYSERHPDDATPHLYLARIHRRLGRRDLAAPALREALRLAPGDADVQTELGFLLLEAGEYETAILRFRAALRTDPGSSAPWIGLVRALEASGRPEAAGRVLESAPPGVQDLFARRGDPAAAQP